MKYIEAHPVPEHLRHIARLRWMITHWCNYSCDFCGVPVFFTRSERFGKQAHAFDYYPVERWLAVLRSIPKQSISLIINGGEPMLDHRNMVPLLNGLIADGRFQIRVNSNATWDPARYASVDASRVGFIVSYHPKQTDLESFRRRVGKIRDAGFSVVTIHAVGAPENMDHLDESLTVLENDGYAVEVMAMHLTGKYMERDFRTQPELDLMRKWTSPIQAHFVVREPLVKGEACFHPSISYDLNYNGNMRVACSPEWRNVFEHGIPELTPYAAECPNKHCEKCFDMIRSLVRSPGYSRGLTAMYPHEYTEEILAMRATRREGRAWPGDELFDGLEQYVRMPRPNGFVPIDHLTGSGTVFGYIDKLTGSDVLQVLNRSRIILSGWAASTRVGEPVQKVELFAGEKPIASIDEFYPRPEVVEATQRPDLLNSGWRTWSYLPQLAKGSHPLTARVTTAGGITGELPPFTLEIVD